jgi:tRNA(Ile)-lysidine synthase
MTDEYPPLATNLFNNHSKIIVGLSGGPDSVYLLHKLVTYAQNTNCTIIAAHLDHEWQESSQIAAQLCKTTCDSLQVGIVLKKLSELKFKHKWNGSQEELGRNARRFFLENLAYELNATAIALAHHQQDQQETFFIRLFRGSSLTGLVGMAPADGLYIRPILHLTKDQILQFLHTNNIAYYTDPTNTSDIYLRNRIRNHVIPACIAADNRFEKNLSSTMQQLTKIDDFITEISQTTLSQIRCGKNIHKNAFLALHTVLQEKILLLLLIEHDIIFTPSQKFFAEIIRFLKTGKSSTHAINQHCTIQTTKKDFTFIKNNHLQKIL